MYSYLSIKRLILNYYYYLEDHYRKTPFFNPETITPIEIFFRILFQGQKHAGVKISTPRAP